MIIPSFAVERTQDLLYYLDYLYENQLVPCLPIYIDSPLAIAATEIFDRHQEYFDQDATSLLEHGKNPLRMPWVQFTRSMEASQKLNGISGAIIIAASGMCDAGRIRHHLKHNLWRPESTILFVGYQAVGTLGRRLLEGEKHVRILGEEIMVRADIRRIEGFSGHADQTGLLAWAQGFQVKPKKFFIVHGEPESSRTLADLITAATGVPAVTPAWQERVILTGAAAKVIDLAEARAHAEQTYQSLLQKLQKLFDDGVAAGNYAELDRQLASLEQNLAGFTRG